MNDAWMLQYDRLVEAYLSWDATGRPPVHEEAPTVMHPDILIIQTKGMLASLIVYFFLHSFLQVRTFVSLP